MRDIVISGTGLFAPEEIISNEELVASFNQYVGQHNREHPTEVPLEPSSAEFIVKASGIHRRHVINKSGILDINTMRPILAAREDSEISLQAEYAVKACRLAMENAQMMPADIDAVVVACSNMQRAYPAIAIEIQSALGIQGFAFDLNVACSSATFGLQTAADFVANGHARAVLVVNPEMCTAHLNFKDRNSHFIFGDACTAMVVTRAEEARGQHIFQVLGTQLETQFSTNIRNNFGFLNRAEPPEFLFTEDKLFYQEGRRVFKEVVPLVIEHIIKHLARLQLAPEQVKRFWLHQANSNMNRLIATKLLGHEPSEAEAPTILDEFGNTSSAGSIIAFHQHHTDFQPGDIGVICSFGAGYSIGSVVLQK